MRFLITNGTKYLQLFCLKHDNKDMYWGYPHDKDMKLSHHESGEYHLKNTGKITYKEFREPLSEINEGYSIGGIGPINDPNFFDCSDFFKEYTGRKLDSILVFDIRPYSFPEYQIYANFGVTEPNNFDLLKKRIWDGFIQVGEVYQLNIITNTNPWIWTVFSGK